MNIANIRVEDVLALTTHHRDIRITAGMVGATVTFDYDSSWDGLSKTAVFKTKKVTKDVLSVGNVVTVPHEVVAESGDNLFVGLYGTDFDNNVIIPTIWVCLGMIYPGANPSDDPGTDPSLPVWLETQQRAEQACAIAEEAKETATQSMETAEYSQSLVSEAMDTANEAMTIAKGRATGYVFDTIADMQTWLSSTEHKSMLKLGDNLYIRDKGVPDYWWDGEKEQLLETQKVDLTEYVKNTDYATADRAGVVRIASAANGTYGLSLIKDQNKFPGGIKIEMASHSAIDAREQQYKPIVPANLDYAIKKGLSGNHEEWTEEEKQAARELIGSASNAWATTDNVGLVRVGEGLYISSSTGKLNVNAAEKRHIDSKNSNGRVITPSNLDYAVKAGLTTNTETLTDEERAAVQEWLGITKLITGAMEGSY